MSTDPCYLASVGIGGEYQLSDCWDLLLPGEKPLVEMICGSRLYGTGGPSSDIDTKLIVLPPIDDILLGKKLRNRQRKIEDGCGTPVEVEFIPLQVFLYDFFEGQTYAVEMAMEIQRMQPVPLPWVPEMIDRFLTRDVSKMVGYAIAQARTYGLKSERFVDLQRVHETMAVWIERDPLILTHPLNMHQDLITELLSFPFVSQVEIQNAGDGSGLAPAIEVYGKKFPFTAMWNTMHQSLMRTLATYGVRARSYADSKADLKALSHAIRITEQITELWLTGDIKLPRANADRLRQIKYGVVPVEDAKEYLQQAYSWMEEVIAKSPRLPERTPELTQDFERFRIDVLRKAYRLNLPVMLPTEWPGI